MRKLRIRTRLTSASPRLDKPSALSLVPLRHTKEPGTHSGRGEGGEELRNCRLPAVPVTSSGRFLSAVTTGPSFLRRRGLLLLSATFCFSLERSFRLGSEAGQDKETVCGLRASQQCFTQPAVELS